MVTKCYKCGRILDETKETYLCCEKCKSFTPNKGIIIFKKEKKRINKGR